MLTSARPFAAHLRRTFHSSARTHMLVGPPDPVSNLRPAVYDQASKPSPTVKNHPYSLYEFQADANPARDAAYQLVSQNQQLDEFNQKFWAESNTRFEAAKGAVLSSLPSSSTPHERELALSEFYKKWSQQEHDRQDAYATEWRARNLANISLAWRLQLRTLKMRLDDLLA